MADPPAIHSSPPQETAGPFSLLPAQGVHQEGQPRDPCRRAAVSVGCQWPLCSVALCTVPPRLQLPEVGTLSVRLSLSPDPVEDGLSDIPLTEYTLPFLICNPWHLGSPGHHTACFPVLLWDGVKTRYNGAMELLSEAQMLPVPPRTETHWLSLFTEAVF